MKKLKYILVTMTCLPAYSSNVTPQWRVGVGVAAEYANYEAKLKIMRFNETVRAHLASNYQQTVKKVQIAPSLEFGRFFNNDFYLGAQLSWRKPNARNSSENDLRFQYFRMVHDFKMNSYSNFFIKPGYRVTPNFMCYGLIGPSIANWSHTTRLLSKSPLMQPYAAGNTHKFKGTSIGLGLGLGVECIAHEKYALSFDYTTYFHRPKKQNIQMTYIEAVLDNDTNGWTYPKHTPNFTRTVQPSYSTFAVRLTYFFNLG